MYNLQFSKKINLIKKILPLSSFSFKLPVVFAFRFKRYGLRFFGLANNTLPVNKIKINFKILN